MRAVFEIWSLGCFKCLLWMKNSGPHSWSIKLWSQGVCSGICNLIKHPDASHVDLKALCLAELSMYYIQSPRMLFISVNVQPRKSAPAFNFTSHILISWTNFKICFYILRKLATINSVVYIGHTFSTFIAPSNPALALFSEKAVFPGCVYQFFVKEKLHQMEPNRQGRL